MQLDQSTGIHARGCLAAALLIGLWGDPAARGQSDDCDSATVIGEGAYSGSTLGSSNDGSAACGDSAGSPDVWYRFDVSDDCELAVDTCGSDYDSVLSIHAACPGTDLNQLACSDDFCGLSSSVLVSASANTTYYIRIAGWQGATGSYALNVSCTVSVQEDDCTAAGLISDGAYAGTTVTATNDGGADCGESAASADVWYQYSAAADGELWVDTCGSAYDTVLSVHTGCPGLAGNQLGCDDDTCALSSRVIVPATAGTTYWFRVAGWQGAVGPYTLNVILQPPSPPGADAYIGELGAFEQFGREGPLVGCAVDSPLCNAGDQPLDWFGNPDPRHPFMAFNLYRLSADRFEQIGQSWVKHGFGAAQESACGFACFPHPDNTRLGVGCSDTYSVGLNAVQGLLGPRYEINPWTGDYTFPGSHLDLAAGEEHDGIQHRLQLHDDDLDPDLNPGATYFAELYIVCHDDVEHMNSIAWEPVIVSGAPGGTWSFDIGGSNTLVGPAVEAWPDATRTIIPANPVDDGRCILAAKVTDNGDGTWHYEYALYNHDMDRQVAQFRIPIAPSTAVTNIGFHAVLSHDEGYSNDPWTAAPGPSAIIWATASYEVNPASNPLRWGTLYSFRFDADAAPAATVATLDLYQPGAPDALSGVTQGPSGAIAFGDMDHDGDVDLRDAALDQNCFTGAAAGPFGATCVPGDFDTDTDIDLADHTAFTTVLSGP